MLLRIILILALAGIGYYGFVRRNKVPVHTVILLAMLGVGVVFVIFPEMANVLAHFFGVGRGADLLTYCLGLFLLFVVIHYYTKFVDLETAVTTLVREIALLRAELGTRQKDDPRTTDGDPARKKQTEDSGTDRGGPR